MHAKKAWGTGRVKRASYAYIQVCVVGKIDEHLGGPRVLAAGSKSNVAALIRLLHGVVLNFLLTPLGRGRGLAGNAELRHETLDGAKKASTLQDVRIDDFTEPRSTKRCPRGLNADPEFGLRLRLQSDIKLDRCGANARSEVVSG